MPVPTIPTPPEAPSTNNPSTFAALADAFIAWFATLVSALNTWGAYVDALLAGAANVGNATSLQGKIWADMLPTEDLLVNGDGMVNQAAAGAGIADDVYDFDQWYALTQTNTINVSQLTDVADGTPFMMRMTQANVTPQRMGRAQIIEGKRCKYLRGQPAVFQFKVRTSSGVSVSYAILEWTGTEDAVTSDVVNDWVSATYTAGNFFITANLTVRAVGTTALSANTVTPLELAATLGSTFNNLILFVWTTVSANQNATFDLAAKCGAGIAGKIFERVPYEETLQACKRYYQPLTWNTINSNVALLQAISTSAAVGFLRLPVSMRAIPTMAATAAEFETLRAGASGTDTLSAFSTLAAFSVDSFQIGSTSANLIAGNAAMLRTTGTTSKIIASSRL